MCGGYRRGVGKKPTCLKTQFEYTRLKLNLFTRKLHKIFKVLNSVGFMVKD